MTVAAIASSSYIMPAMGWAELRRAVRMAAASALTSPDSTYTIVLWKRTDHAGEPRRLLVAADRVDVAAEARAGQDEVGGDVDGQREQDRHRDHRGRARWRALRKPARRSRRSAGRRCRASAAPRATLIMPSVAMKGGSRPQRDQRARSASPQRRPRPEPGQRAPAACGQPACSALASTTPESATSEPTERSMPPERITNVMPTAITALMEVCSITLSRFETVRKCGREHGQQQATAPTRPASVPSSRPRR